VIEGGRSGRLARVPFLLALMFLLGLGMAGLLALNTGLQGQAFEARALHQQANRLTYQEAALQKQVEDLRAIDNLAARASQLGMRPNPHPGFVRVTDGKQIGKVDRQPVSGNEVPSLIVKTPEQIAAEKKAAEARKKAAEARRQAAAAQREAEERADQQRAAQARARQAEQDRTEVANDGQTEGRTEGQTDSRRETGNESDPANRANRNGRG
jgi:hypothetical protein